MKKFYLAILTVLFLLSGHSSKAKADDYGLIRQYMFAEIEKGTTQSHFARQLGVSDATVSLFLNHKIKSSPKLLINFKSRLGETYKRLTTPQKNKKKIMKTKARAIKKLNFENENVITPVKVMKAEGLPLRDMEQDTLVDLLNKPSQIKAKKKVEIAKNFKKASIVIAYREEGSGKGAFYDHYTLQKATDYPTLISAHKNMRLKTLKEQAMKMTCRLKYGMEEDGQVIPNTTKNFADNGLLFIPGRIRDNEFDPLRKAHEQHLLKQALLRGQPILAVCAGSWRLWEALGGELAEVQDHSYGGGMIRLSADGKIGYNKQIHRIKTEKNTFLEAIMETTDENCLPSVNSVHWKAPSSKKVPFLATLSAKAMVDDKIAPNTRQGVQMKPQSESIEAFESKYGVPFLGIQWHPEAYTKADSKEMTPEKHLAILQYMAKAGQAYHYKRLMLKELEEMTLKH